MFQKAWLTLMGDEKNSQTNSFRPRFPDPFDLSRYIPPQLGKSVKERGIIRLHDSDDFYEADLWMWNMTLSGLSDMFLHEVKILRDESLSMLILQVETGLDEMLMSGVHNLTGWL